MIDFFLGIIFKALGWYIDRYEKDEARKKAFLEFIRLKNKDSQSSANLHDSYEAQKDRAKALWEKEPPNATETKP